MTWRVLGRSLAVSAVLILGLGLAGCAQDEPPVPRVASDLSGPKPAALTFLRAIAAGDDCTARDASLGTPAQKQWIVAMTSLVTGMRRYDRALLARFGQRAVSADVDLRQAIETMTQDPISHMEGGILSQSEDSALIYPGYRDIKLAGRAPMRLRREGKVWKVDLPGMADEPQYSPDVVRRYQEAGKALTETARQIRAGRYQTLDEAEDAIGQNLKLATSGA